MTLKLATYQNSTELAQLNGIPLYMNDMVDAALRGKLNVFLQGDTGLGKTQIVRDVMQYFGDKGLFILGRNDMDTRELFQRINPAFYRALKEGKDMAAIATRELTDKIDYNFIAVDELPNCVPAVRAQLFNLFDGFIEVEGRPYPIGKGYCMGMATGNIGQKFTESSNELGRALKDRMHLTIDTDSFRPQPYDTMAILSRDRNPRVNMDAPLEKRITEIREASQKLQQRELPFEKIVVAQYLLHGLDYLEGGRSKTQLKSGWPTKLEGHEAGSDAALTLPVSIRAAKSILTLSQALDAITEEQGAQQNDAFNSMMVAFKFVGAYSGILNEALVEQNYDGDKYKAMEGVIEATRSQFNEKDSHIAAGLGMAQQGKKNSKLLNEFSGRWSFMRNMLEKLAEEVPQ